MKKFFITSATLCLGWLSAGAQQMSAEQATVDCGQVIFAHPVTVEYKLRNDATKPLVITKVYTSCGCATVSYPKSVIAAGDSFTLSATYDAQQMGHFEKLVGVYGTNGENPLMLTMKGVVVSEKQDFSGQYPYKIGDFLCDVADLEFDDVNVGDKPMAKIHIMNNTDVGTGTCRSGNDHTRLSQDPRFWTHTNSHLSWLGCGRQSGSGKRNLCFNSALAQFRDEPATTFECSPNGDFRF